MTSEHRKWTQECNMPALIEAAQERADRALAIRRLREWMREPDHVENASLEWMTGWINRRPFAEMSVLFE